MVISAELPSLRRGAMAPSDSLWVAVEWSFPSCRSNPDSALLCCLVKPRQCQLTLQCAGHTVGSRARERSVVLPRCRLGKISCPVVKE